MGLEETEPRHIKITVEDIELEIDIIGKDANDCVMVAGHISKLLKKLLMKAKVVVLPL